MFLLARATGFGDAFSLLMAALVNWGAALPGPAVYTVDTEPVPMAFACGATLLAAGCSRRPNRCSALWPERSHYCTIP